VLRRRDTARLGVGGGARRFFPFKREFNGNFFDSGPETAFPLRKPQARSDAWRQIPVAEPIGNCCRPKRELNAPNRELRELTAEHHKSTKKNHISPSRQNFIELVPIADVILPHKFAFHEADQPQLIARIVP
jgi:hypothetical protein